MTTFFGYIGEIWAVAFAALRYLQTQLAAAPVAAQTEAVAATVFETVINALYAVNAARYQSAWQQESIIIGEAIALPITFDANALAYLNQRSLTYSEAAAALQALLPQPPFPIPAVVLPLGQPVIPDPGLIGFFQNFAFEQPPNGLSANTLLENSQAAATAFETMANQISVFQGAYLTQAYDALKRLQLTQQIATNLMASITSSGFSETGFSNGVSGLWNQLAVLPAMLIDGAILSSSAASLAVQQAAVIRNALITAAKSLALFITVLRRPNASSVNLAKVMVGDTLMDIAARALGNFEQWSVIASINNLVPPYIAPVSAPGVAGYGSQLILPTPGTKLSPSGLPPSYLNDFLGIDLYVGPINQPMPAWTGDFQTIAGYQNLRWALGRRAQTPLGSLVYHIDYGSRLPGEVGTTQTAPEAGRTAAFGKSALLADPRVARVLEAQAAVGDNGKISFTGTVQPKGFGAQPVDVVEIITGS